MDMSMTRGCGAEAPQALNATNPSPMTIARVNFCIFFSPYCFLANSTILRNPDQPAIRAAANAMAEQLSHRATTLQSLALRVGDLGSLDEILASSAFLLDDFDAGLAVFSRKGTLLASSNDSQLWDQLQQGGDLSLQAAL